MNDLMKHSGRNFRNLNIWHGHYIFQDRRSYSLENLSRCGDEARLCHTRLHCAFVLCGERKDLILTLALKGCQNRQLRAVVTARIQYSLASKYTVA